MPSDRSETGSERQNPRSVICVQIPVRDVVATNHEMERNRPLHLPANRDEVVA